jgi:hypothetical protein
MKAPSPTGKALSRRFDGLFYDPVHDFFRASSRHHSDRPSPDRERKPTVCAARGEYFSDHQLPMRQHDFLVANAAPLLDAMLRMTSHFEQLRIAFNIHQNFTGDDFGLSKIKVMQACLNKLPHFIVRRASGFGVVEYHQSDTDAVAPVQYVIRSESARFPEDLTNTAFGTASSVGNRTNLGVLSNEHVHEVTLRLSSRFVHQSISGCCWTRAFSSEACLGLDQLRSLAPDRFIGHQVEADAGGETIQASIFGLGPPRAKLGRPIRENSHDRRA